MGFFFASLSDSSCVSEHEEEVYISQNHVNYSILRALFPNLATTFFFFDSHLMGDNIYIKENIIKNLPLEVQSKEAPILYAENAQMPNRTYKKSKSCIVVITMAGVYFCRPKFSSYKVSLFISIYDITKIEKKEQNRRDIYASNKLHYIIADHVDQAIAEIITCREILNSNSKNPKHIETYGYPKVPESTKDTTKTTESLSSVKYYCLCTKYNEEVQDSMLKFYKALDRNRSRKVIIDKLCVLPDNISIFLQPLITHPRIVEMELFEVAPYYACKIATNVLKKSPLIRHVKFSNYKILTPEQLYFKKRVLKPISFSFNKCDFGDDLWARIVNKIGSLDASVQRFSIKKCPLTQNSYQNILNSISSLRAFRTIENLEIDGIEMVGTWSTAVAESITQILEKSRFTAFLSLSNWSFPTLFKLKNFGLNSFLSEIILQGQNLPFESCFTEIPKTLRLLDISNAFVSYKSLRKLFLALSKDHLPFTLCIADIQMPESHWSTFYESLPEMPKPVELCELDISGCPLPLEFVDAIGSYFNNCSLQYLNISRIFTPQKLNILSNFLSSINSPYLWGITIQGSASTCLQMQDMQALFSILAKLSNLQALDISNQQLSLQGCKQLLSFCTSKELIQVSFDGTSISSTRDLYQIYSSFIENTKLNSIGRPFSDLTRLKANQNEKSFINFQSQIRGKLMPATRRIRRISYGLDGSGAYVKRNLKNLSLYFPLIHIDYPEDDFYSLVPSPSKHARKTVFVTAENMSKEPLEDIQNANLISPYELPNYLPPDGDIEIPESMAYLNNNPGLLRKQDAKIINIDLNLDELSNCPEMNGVLDILASTITFDDLFILHPEEKVSELSDLQQKNTDNFNNPNPQEFVALKEIVETSNASEIPKLELYVQSSFDTFSDEVDFEVDKPRSVSFTKPPPQIQQSHIPTLSKKADLAPKFKEVVTVSESIIDNLTPFPIVFEGCNVPAIKKDELLFDIKLDFENPKPRNFGYQNIPIVEASQVPRLPIKKPMESESQFKSSQIHVFGNSSSF